MFGRKKSLFLIFISLIFIIPLASSINVSTNVDYSVEDVIIFAEEICPVCPQEKVEWERQQQYIQSIDDELDSRQFNMTLLTDLNDYQELALHFQEVDVPDSMRTSDMAVIIDEKFIFVSYVPVEFIVEFVMNLSHSYDRFIIAKDPLQPMWYKVVIGKSNEVKWCRIEYSLEECMDDSDEKPSPFSIIPIIFFSGLLDGINPCAFSVLLFFIVFVFSVSSLRRNGEALEDLHNAGKDVRRIGSFYILGVWLAYLLIGLSLFQGLRLAPFPNLIGLISSLIVILFGILNVADFFWPGKFSLRMSSSQWGTVRRWMRKFTVPTAFVAGLLVSIFEFPCTGGIYISILGLLAQNTSFLEGFSYLLIYNVAFVIPLVSIVVFMSIKDVSTFSLENWEQKYGKQMRLILGLIMITIGLFLVFWEYT